MGDDLPELLARAARPPALPFDPGAAWRRGVRRRRGLAGLRAAGVAAVVALIAWQPAGRSEQRMAFSPASVPTAAVTPVPAAAPPPVTEPAPPPPTPAPPPTDPAWFEPLDPVPVPAATAAVSVTDGTVTVTAGALGLDAQAFTAALVQAGVAIETRTHAASPAAAGEVLGVEAGAAVVDPAHTSFRIVVAQLTGPVVVHEGGDPPPGEQAVRSALWPGEVLGSVHCAGPLTTESLADLAERAGVRVEWRQVRDDGSQVDVDRPPEGMVEAVDVSVSDWVVALVAPPGTAPDLSTIPCDAEEAARLGAPRVG